MEFKKDQKVKPSQLGIRIAGLKPDLRGIVRGMTPDRKVVVKIENRERPFPPSWFEEAPVDEKKPVSHRYDQCRFQAGETVRFKCQAHGFEGSEHLGKIIAVVSPKTDPMEVLGDTYSDSHSFRVDRMRLQPNVRTHRYWIEAIPNDSKKAKPALFLKSNGWVRKRE